MHILASILDPADNGFDISDLMVVLALIGVIVAAVAAIWRWIAEPRISRQITDATKPIQPYANGGKSLPDLHTKVDVLIERQADIAKRLDNHITWHLDKE